MATEKKITSRIQQKHDVAANWAKATNFIPKKGEIIIYDAEYSASGVETQAVRFKIGDGSKTVNNLPFAVIDGIQKISGEFYFLETEDGSIVGINDRGVMIMSKPNNPSLFIVGKEGDMDLYAALMVQSSGDVTSPSTITIGLGEPTVVQLEGQEAGSAKQVFTSQGNGATPKWTSVVNSLNGNTGDITGIATTSQLDNKQDKITSSNKLSSSLIDGLGAAAAKAVDTAISANSTSTNLPTSKAVEDRINAHSGIDKVGTVTGVKMNGTTKNPSSGVVDLGTVLTAHQSLDGKQDKITSSNKLAASLVSGLATVATSGSYNDLSNKPNIPTVNNGTLTIQKNGTKVATFTANQSAKTTANITVPIKVSELTNDSGYTTNKGTVTSVSIKMNGASKGTVTSSGTIDLGTVITSHQNISGKLDKTTYEVNKTIDFGSSGVLYVGKFKVYDTNVTCEVTSTTNVTYSGKLVIATQNYAIAQMTVYGDAANTVAPNFFVKPSTTSNPYIEVYFKPASWSKNVVHIYGSNIQAEPTDVCTNVPSVPSTATSKPKNALPIYSLSGTTLTITL